MRTVHEHIKFGWLDRAGAGLDAVAPAIRRAHVRGRRSRAAPRGGCGQGPVVRLAVIEQELLRHCFFPLGASLKSDVRAEAEARGLRTASKPDSHDICFIPDGDTAGFLTKALGEKPGPVVDVSTGRDVGGHQGTFTVTIGQRRGLDLRIPGEDGRPRYVVDIDDSTDTVYVGSAEMLDVDGLVADHVIWAAPALTAEWSDVSAQVRAHHHPVPARARILDDTIDVFLLEPVRGLATGQTVVLYSDSRVLGSGRICQTRTVSGVKRPREAQRA